MSSLSPTRRTFPPIARTHIHCASSASAASGIRSRLPIDQLMAVNAITFGIGGMKLKICITAIGILVFAALFSAALFRDRFVSSKLTYRAPIRFPMRPTVGNFNKASQALWSSFNAKVKFVEKNFKSESFEWLRKLGTSPDDWSASLVGEEEVKVEDILFVSASDHSHFEEQRSAYNNFHHFFPSHQLLFYDLGLKPMQAKEVNLWCNVTYVRFNFSRYPDHTRNLHTYAWKPFCIADALKKAKGVAWMDSSLRFAGTDLSNISTTWKATGGFSMLLKIPRNVIDYTHSGMYQYLTVNRKLLQLAATKGHYDAGFLAMERSFHSTQHILHLWMLCAVTHECISPAGSSTDCPKLRQPPCHRFDQAALNLILYILHNYEINRFEAVTQCYKARGDTRIRYAQCEMKQR